MTLTLELTPDQDRRIRAIAARLGLTPAEYALRQLLPEEHLLGVLTAIASEDALTTIWDTPAEEEAWRHLQPAT